MIFKVRPPNIAMVRALQKVLLQCSAML